MLRQSVATPPRQDRGDRCIIVAKPKEGAAVDVQYRPESFERFVGRLEYLFRRLVDECFRQLSEEPLEFQLLFQRRVFVLPAYRDLGHRADKNEAIL